MLALAKGGFMGVFGSLVVCYLFLGGMGGGSVLALSCLEAANSPRIASRRLRLPRKFFSIAWSACFVALGLACACLLADLGRADRALSLFLSPTFSVMSLGAWSLAASLVLSAAFAAASLFACDRLLARFSFAGGIAGALAGVLVAAYTGVLLGGIAAVLAWQTPLLVALFVLSSASCGIALCLGALTFTGGRMPLSSSLSALARADFAVILLEAVCLAAYVAWLWATNGTSDAAYALLAGPLRWRFWIGLVVIGLALPIAMECLAMYGDGRTWPLWVTLCVFVGGVSLRSLVVDISAFDVTQAATLASSLATI